MTDYNAMTYAQLKKLAAERGIPAVGTKDELVLALSDADTDTELNEPLEPNQATTEPAPAAKKQVSEAQVAKEWNSDAQKMKAHLDAQPKVRIMIPLDPGVKPQDADKIPFTVNLNGYRMEIKRGVFVDVPQQVAEIVQERLESEGKIGSEHRLDRNPDKLEALIG